MSRQWIYVAAIFLIVAVLPMPYGYYTALRIGACGLFLWLAFRTGSFGHEQLAWSFGVLAIIFNPVIPVFFPKIIWSIIDIGTAIFLILTASFMSRNSAQKEAE